MIERLTCDNPLTNLQNLLNFAYDKNRRVVLRFADGRDDRDLCENIADAASANGCPTTADGVMNNGDCMECDCVLAHLNVCAIQAAELRARLKAIEDILGDYYDLDILKTLMDAAKEGRIAVLPSKVGSEIYIKPPAKFASRFPAGTVLCRIAGSAYTTCDGTRQCIEDADPIYEPLFFTCKDIGRTVFRTPEEARNSAEVP